MTEKGIESELAGADHGLIRWCKCAEMYYRNNHDGTRDYTIKGVSSCPMCHGSGYVAQCVDCSGAGVVRNARCAACGGCGVRSKEAPWRPLGPLADVMDRSPIGTPYGAEEPTR